MRRFAPPFSRPLSHLRVLNNSVNKVRRLFTRSSIQKLLACAVIQAICTKHTVECSVFTPERVREKTRLSRSVNRPVYVQGIWRVQIQKLRPGGDVL